MVKLTALLFLEAKMKRPNKLRKNIHKNRNWIFAIAEIGLAGGALYFAGKGTLKFQKYLEEDNDPAPAAVKSYWPAAACYGGFVVLRIYDAITTTHMQKHYAGALMALQGIVASKTLPDYISPSPNKDKLDEMERKIGKSDYNYKIFYYDNDLPCMAEMARNADPGYNDLFFVPDFGLLFCSSVYDVDNAENKALLQLESDQDLYLNDLLDYWGLAKTGFGTDHLIYGNDHDFGEWTDGPLFDISPGMSIGDDPQLFYVINFTRKWHNIYEETK